VWSHAQPHRHSGLRRSAAGGSVRKSESDHNHLTTSGGKSIITFVSQTAWRMIAHRLRAKTERVRNPRHQHQACQKGTSADPPGMRGAFLPPARSGSHCPSLSPRHPGQMARAMCTLWQASTESVCNQRHGHQGDQRPPSQQREAGFSPWLEKNRWRVVWVRAGKRGSGAWPRCEVRWVFAETTSTATGGVLHQSLGSRLSRVVRSFLRRVYCKQVDELRAMGGSQGHSHFPSTPGRSFA